MCKITVQLSLNEPQMMSIKTAPQALKLYIVPMVQYIKDKLKMASLMEEVQWSIKMVSDMRDNSIKAINMGKESIITLRVSFT